MNHPGRLDETHRVISEFGFYHLATPQSVQLYYMKTNIMAVFNYMLNNITIYDDVENITYIFL